MEQIGIFEYSDQYRIKGRGTVWTGKLVGSVEPGSCLSIGGKVVSVKGVERMGQRAVVGLLLGDTKALVQSGTLFSVYHERAREALATMLMQLAESVPVGTPPEDIDKKELITCVMRRLASVVSEAPDPDRCRDSFSVVRCAADADVYHMSISLRLPYRSRPKNPGL